MRLHIEDGAIHAGRKGRDVLSGPAEIAAVLIERGRYPAIARILAFGGSLDTSAARQYGKELGLIQKEATR